MSSLNGDMKCFCQTRSIAYAYGDWMVVCFICSKKIDKMQENTEYAHAKGIKQKKISEETNPGTFIVVHISFEGKKFAIA